MSRINDEVWNLPIEVFSSTCEVMEMLPDQDSYPLLPDGNNIWRFNYTTNKLNLSNFYSNWAFQYINSKKRQLNGHTISYVVKSCLGVVLILIKDFVSNL